jgi:hypothetical protein
VLAGRYRLDDRVRTRPDGSLWRAVDETLERPVLVSAYAVGHPYGGEIVDAARRAALVEDPRLQRVLAAGTERGTPYVVLEPAPGRSLTELLQNGPLAAETGRRLAGEAAEALDLAAARGLHHLRLRPTSLIVARDGTVTVAGTAIDAAADGIESPTSAAAARSDAAGLVALLYAALTGRWPGTQEAGLARAPRVAGRPVPPGDLVAGVPNDLDTLCSVMLGPHDDGPRSPGELAAQLTPWAPAAPLTDPRGLHIGAPGRPGLTAPPVRAARTRSRSQSPTAEVPPVPAAGPVPMNGDPLTADPPTADPLTADPLTAGPGPAGPAPAEQPPAAAAAARSAPAAASPTDPDQAGDAPATTTGELRRLLRGSLRGPATAGGGIPLAAMPPPAGSPLADVPTPVGAPVPTPAALPRIGAASPQDASPRAARTHEAPPEAPREAPSRGAPPENASSRAAPAREAAPPPVDPVPVRVPAAPPSDRSRHAAAPPPTPAPTSTPNSNSNSTPAPAAARLSPPVPPPVPPPVRAPLRPPAPTPAPQKPARHRTNEWRDEPTGGLDALQILGSAASAEEPLAPFAPTAPLDRPPRAQSRLVLVVLGVLLVVVLVAALSRIVDFHPAPLINKGGGAPSTPSAGPSGPAAATSAPAAPSPAPGSAAGTAAPVSVAGVQALDPQGDDNENNDLAARAIDGDPSTSWHSDRYSSPEFGGLKKGLGLAVDLGEASAVHSVTVTAPGTDGTIELRTADGPDIGASTVVATGRLTGSGTVELRPTAPVSTRELIVWFTRLPDSGGEGRRAVVAEIDVR